MTSPASLVIQASAVVIDGQALAIEGPPGSGKSSLALALIDRGAGLIGDDSVSISRKGDVLYASPPPNIAGLLEIRGAGLMEMTVAKSSPLAMILTLGASPEDRERLPQTIPTRDMLGVAVPCLSFAPGTIAPAVRAEYVLKMHGLTLVR